MNRLLMNIPAQSSSGLRRLSGTLLSFALVCACAFTPASAYGSAGPASVSPSPVNFGSVAVGNSSTITIAFYNSGSTAIGPVSTPTTSGGNASDFKYTTNGCYKGDASKAKCYIGVQFSPQATGTRTTTLTLTDNATNGPQHVTLTGTGTPANTSTISISPSSFSWGSANVGSTTASQTFTLKAINGSVSISNIAVAGTDPGDFIITGKTCGSSLASGAPCTVNVAFKAARLGNRVALLSVTDSGHDSPQTAAVSGTGAYSTAQGVSVTVNLGNRTGGVTIPKNILGTEYLESLPTGTQSKVVSAGFTAARYRLQLDQVFPTSTNAPSWGLITSDIGKLKAAGVLNPIVMIENTPKSLGSSLNCPPANLSAWGALAAQVAAHIEQTYPRYVQYYEIWNEPNTTNMCGATSAARAAKYIPLYAAAAPQIKAAVTKVDGATALVGGPATAGVDADFAPLLTNSTTAPYVDFYSYHFYVGTSTNISQGMGWDTSTNHLYSMILNSGSGVQRRYMEAVDTVKTAKTPKGANTPIFYDEYNDDWDFVNDCCRNTPKYSPLYNSMVVAQVFNSVYHGANQVPSNMTYFAAAQVTFCILAIPDSSWDCQKAVTQAQAQPYPQWYTYNLIFGGSYLDLKDGGHMATSISSPPAGLIATAYWTPYSDSVLIINPTGNSFSPVTLQIDNPGGKTNATLYTINVANPHVSSWPAHMLSVSGGTQTTFDVPAYSVLAVSLK